MEFEPIELRKGDWVLVRVAGHWKPMEVIPLGHCFVVTSKGTFGMDQQGVAWHRIPRPGEAVCFRRGGDAHWECGVALDRTDVDLSVLPERGIPMSVPWHDFRANVECAKAGEPSDAERAEDGPMHPAMGESWDNATAASWVDGAAAVEKAARAVQKRREQAQSQAKASLDGKPMSERLGDLPQLPDLNCAYYIRVYDSYANNYKLKQLKVHEAKTSRSGERTLILEEE